jgi:HSP20 family protein
MVAAANHDETQSLKRRSIMNTSPTKLQVKTEGTTPVATGQSWSLLDSLRQDIDRLFDDFHPLSWRSPFSRGRRGGAIAADTRWQIAPAVDVVERNQEYEITAELPGMDESNIEVSVLNGMLTLKGEKTEEKEEKEKDYYLSERSYGSFQRSFPIPDVVDANKIEASFAKGLLTIKLPKSAEAQKNEKKIPVKSA